MTVATASTCEHQARRIAPPERVDGLGEAPSRSGWLVAAVETVQIRNLFLLYGRRASDTPPAAPDRPAP